MARRDRLVMSRPSNVTAPEVSGIRPAMQRASVDFPQPVSPTRPSVWPRRVVRDTPSTGWTLPAAQPLRSLGKADGASGREAGGAVAPRRAHGDQVRLLGQAPVHYIGTPWVEGTAGGKPDQAGRLAADRLEPFGGG